MSMRCYYNQALYSKFGPKLGVSEAELQAEARKKCSKLSFVSISTSFIQRVEEMDKTILVPTKLMDIDCKDDPQIPAIVQNGTTNLYEVYTVIKSLKEKLVSMELDDQPIGSITPYEVDSDLLPSSPLDSGHWSSTGSTAMSSSSNGSVNSEEEGSISSDTELSEVNYRVKRSLISAKGLAASLIDLFELTDYVIHRYCEEFQCDIVV